MFPGSAAKSNLDGFVHIGYHVGMRHVAQRPAIEHPKPLTEPALLILMSLAAQPRHGYALIKDIEALSRHRVRLNTGTLYGALRRLLDEGWIGPLQQEHTSRVN